MLRGGFGLAISGVGLMVLVSGCSLHVPANQLEPKIAASRAYPVWLDHDVCVETGAPGKMAFNIAFGVERTALAKALRQEMAKDSLLGTAPSCHYTLTARITHLSGPDLALPFVSEDFHARIDYLIVTKPLNTTFFEQTVDDRYTQPYIFIPFSGAIPTQRRGEARVIRHNITAFENDLLTASMKAQPAPVS